MKSTRLAIAIAMACGLSAATASAQSDLRQPAQRTAYSYGSYNYYAADETPSPSDKAPMPPASGDKAPAPADAAAAPAPAAASCSSCGGGCSTCDHCLIQDYQVGSWGCALTCPTACPQWSLFGDCCFLKEHNTTLTGWVDGGATGNASSPHDRFNGPVTFDDRSNDAEMNQLYMRLNRAVKTDSCCWSFGYNVDVLYGTDARFTKAIGLETHDDGSDKWNSQSMYQISMPQAYGEIGYNNWDIKLGRWYTLAGYEVVTAPDNFFYSHSYSFQYGEPFTHTGALATKKINDQFSYSVGIERGWDQWDDFLDDDRAGFIGGVNFATKDQKTKLAVTLTEGDEVAGVGAGGAVLGNRTLISSVFTRVVNDRLTYVFQNDYGQQDHGVGAAFTDTAKWYSINQYLLYQLNCNWWGGVRFEWFRDQGGTRVAQLTPPGDTTTSTSQFGTGYDGSFYETAIGLNYKPLCNPNLVVRPEIRYDWYQGKNGVDEATGAARRPFNDGGSLNQFTGAFDVIYKF